MSDSSAPTLSVVIPAYNEARVIAATLAIGWISDVTCGFKAFDRVVAQRLVALQRLDGWVFDAELLFIARRLGYPIREIPVTWRDDPASKVHMLRDLLAIRLGALRGFYPAGRS